MQANQLQHALQNLSEAIRETESVLEIMRAEHDPSGSFIAFDTEGLNQSGGTQCCTTTSARRDE
jgi:hypothetical protein